MLCRPSLELHGRVQHLFLVLYDTTGWAAGQICAVTSLCHAKLVLLLHLVYNARMLQAIV